MPFNLSAFVLTYNEENNIGACLESLKDLSDDIHIADSYSSDRTLSICEEYGCQIHQRKFDTFAKQCNWALSDFPFKHEWILRLDADERIPTQLTEELRAKLPSFDNRITAILLKKRFYFMGRWIRHGSIYPVLRLALCRKGAGYYEEREEEQFVLTAGKSIEAENDYYEYNMNNDLRFFMGKHLDYAEDEFREYLENSQKSDLIPRLFGNKIERTRWLKLHVYNRCPLFVRPFLLFIYRYVLRLGFLDGKAGLVFHVLQAFWYRFYVDARIYETRSRWKETEKDFRRT